LYNFGLGRPDEDCDDVADDFDSCPGTAPGAAVDGFGCSDAQNGGGGSDDTDGDGIPDSNDACPNEASTAENDADSDGCPDDNGGGNNGGGDGGDGSGSGNGGTDADNDGVSDDEDDCPNTPAGESVDFFGCSDSQNGGGGGGSDGSGDGSGNNGGGDNGGGGFGGLDDICIPSGTDMSQETVIKSDLTYPSGINELNFPLTEGKVWSEASVGTGTISLSIKISGCTISTMDMDDSGALPS
jgi:hypothetical protein